MALLFTLNIQLYSTLNHARYVSIDVSCIVAASKANCFPKSLLWGTCCTKYIGLLAKLALAFNMLDLRITQSNRTNILPGFFYPLASGRFLKIVDNLSLSYIFANVFRTLTVKSHCDGTMANNLDSKLVPIMAWCRQAKWVKVMHRNQFWKFGVSQFSCYTAMHPILWYSHCFHENYPFKYRFRTHTIFIWPLMWLYS